MKSRLIFTLALASVFFFALPAISSAGGNKNKPTVEFTAEIFGCKITVTCNEDGTMDVNANDCTSAQITKAMEVCEAEETE